MARALLLSAQAARQQQLTFVHACGFQALRTQLPLRWPTPADGPPSPKTHYRSHYVYLGSDDLLTHASLWGEQQAFELLLRLVDFAPLRPVLAQLLGWTSAKGWIPFDPVSMFLLHGWQITQQWTRATTLRNLALPRYADIRERLGFADEVYPTEGGCRHFLTALGQHSPDADPAVHLPAYGESAALDIAQQRLNGLLVQAAELLQAHGFLSPESWDQALVCPDGMLHPAASHMRCTAITATCYQPAPRPCPARELKHRQGCSCDTRACTQICQHAPSRDADARYIWYTASNTRPNNPNRPQTPSPGPRGFGVYGYKSVALILADPVHRTHITLLSDFGPATLNEADRASALLLTLPTLYPTLHLSAVAGDAAYGTDRPLHLIYSRLGARRVIDLRAHQSDKLKLAWPERGYDDRGRPICPYGYRCIANGFDAHRRRTKWLCAQQCLRPAAQPAVTLPDLTYPPTECPYQDAAHAPHGLIFNLAEAFPDGSLRLARDVPVGSAQWQRTYQRARNASEARNAGRERDQLKRLPYFGTARNRAILALADTWDTLTTLARLCREATAATGGCTT